MSPFFCDEPIKRVYLGMPLEANNDNLFLDIYYGVSLYLTAKYRYLLETENHYISLEYDGVMLFPKNGDLQSMEKNGEFLESFYSHFDEAGLPWVDHEHTLFVGQRLIEVINREGYYELVFDDFELKLVPCGEEDVLGASDRIKKFGYYKINGFDRYLKKKCACGGNGELFLDFVADYIVRCDKCLRATWAQMNLQDALDEWNNGVLNCDASEIDINCLYARRY